MRGEVNNIQRGKLGRVSTPLCPLANSTAGHPWVTSLSKGQRVLKSPDNPAALGGAGGGVLHKGHASSCFHHSLFRGKVLPRAGQFSPGPVCSGATAESPAQMFYSFS